MNTSCYKFCYDSLTEEAASTLIKLGPTFKQHPSLKLFYKLLNTKIDDRNKICYLEHYNGQHYMQ